MEENRVILSHNCGIGLNKGLASEIENIFLITNPPYISENAFGALSMAMASANHDILTKVVFIEDGIYCLSGIHEIQPDDHIFNVQDIIESTGDMESLQYYLYEPSVEMRGVDILDYVKEFKTIQSQGLKDVLFDFNFEQTQGKPKMRSIKHKRIIFY